MGIRVEGKGVEGLACSRCLGFSKKAVGFVGVGFRDRVMYFFAFRAEKIRVKGVFGRQGYPGGVDSQLLERFCGHR